MAGGHELGAHPALDTEFRTVMRRYAEGSLSSTVTVPRVKMLALLKHLDQLEEFVGDLQARLALERQAKCPVDGLDS